MPVFVDVDAGTLNLDAALVERQLARKPIHPRLAMIRAILPVHLYGQCADMDGVRPHRSRRFCRKEFGVAIVEDAAQAIGAEWNADAARARSA
jgi:dTDP-4-amino-4,6-dideoxygalactose transaminase